MSDRVSHYAWDGYVSKVNRVTFDAVLAELGKPLAEDIVRFRISSLSPFDQGKLTRGAYLKWEIYSIRGKRKSRVWLRRKTWTRRELERADKQADKLWKMMKWSD